MEKGETLVRQENPSTPSYETNEMSDEFITVGDAEYESIHATGRIFPEPNEPVDDCLLDDNSEISKDSFEARPINVVTANKKITFTKVFLGGSSDTYEHYEVSETSKETVHNIECIEEVVIPKVDNADTVDNNLDENVKSEAEENINGHDNDKSDLSEDEINDNKKNNLDNNQKEICSVVVSRPDTSNQNFQNAILEDWCTENGTYATGTDEKIILNVKNDNDAVLEESVVDSKTEISDIKPMEVDDAGTSNMEYDASSGSFIISTYNGVTPIQPVTTKPRLCFSTSKVSRKEVIEEILRNKTSPAILPKKDIILAMELAKHSIQGPCVDEVDDTPDEHDIIQILEADQVGDWRGSIAVPIERGGTDLDIVQEVIVTKPLQNNQTKRFGRPKGVNAEKLRETKRKRVEERARQRKLALEQLAKEFKERSPARRKAVKDAPNIAAVDLKRVLASTPVITGKRKRRPCYQPPADDEPSEEDLQDHPPSAIIKTYTPKPRTSNNQTDIQTELETIAIVKKHLAENEKLDEIVPKKTVKKVRGSGIVKKPGRELQQLLGDEGAVRMLYDAAQKGSPNDSHTTRVIKHTKKELEEKAKFVENAVLYLSGASEKTLRGKRLVAAVSEGSSPPAEPLFPPALPDATSNTSSTYLKAKKKPKPAEASRILYRHSSSESFDGSEGLRRSVSELSGIDFPITPTKIDSLSLPQRKSLRPRKISSKLSEYVAGTIIPKKIKKEETTLEPVTFSTPKTIKSHSKRMLHVDSAATSSAKKTNVEVQEKEVKVVPADVRVAVKGALVEITLASNHSSFQNALTEGVLQQLKDALESASSNPSCKAILLKSKSKVFCQGIDLGVLAPGFDVNGLVHSIKSLATTLIFLEKPIIVGVRGVAVGMGVALLPLCDVVVASEDSSFYTPYGRLGHGPEAASSFTFPRIGKALVSELIYKGSVLSADDAFQLGLISQVVSPGKFDAELNQVVESIVSQNYVALQQSKKLIFGAEQQNMIDALERECKALLTSWSSPDCLSAVAEFLASGELLSN